MKITLDLGGKIIYVHIAKNGNQNDEISTKKHTIENPYKIVRLYYIN
ncbi:MAG: hypothetical protein IKL46_09010 [Clostridia bacterium]|nr:hypothetical protein [Clostridia bacterium]